MGGWMGVGNMKRVGLDYFSAIHISKMKNEKWKTGSKMKNEKWKTGFNNEKWKIKTISKMKNWIKIIFFHFQNENIHFWFLIIEEFSMIELLIFSFLIFVNNCIFDFSLLIIEDIREGVWEYRGRILGSLEDRRSEQILLAALAASKICGRWNTLGLSGGRFLGEYGG